VAALFAGLDHRLCRCCNVIYGICTAVCTEGSIFKTGLILYGVPVSEFTLHSSSLCWLKQRPSKRDQPCISGAAKLLKLPMGQVVEIQSLTSVEHTVHL